MTTPTELIDDARGYVSGLLSAAESSLGSAVRATENLGYTQLSYTGSTLPAPPPSTINLTLPPLSDVSLDLPAAPSTSLVFQDIAAIEAGLAPTLTAAAPVLTMPNTPASLAAFTAQLPSVDLSAQFPIAPSLIVPEAPTLPDRTAPLAPTVTLPSFGGQMPVGIPSAPSDLKGSFNAAYHTAAPEFISMVNGHVDAQLLKLNPQYHAQMARIEAQLTTYLNGGTGLNPSAENAIYERARGKNHAEACRVRDQAYAEAAGRGFTLPIGALMSAAQQARQAGADNNARAAGEIVVMQAEMEQKNLQFAVTTSAGLRSTMVSAMLSYMQNLSQLNGQALDYAKSILGAIIEMYNTAVKVYSLKLEGYKTEAAVFETLMRAALAGIEIYKAEIDAVKALTQVDMAKIDVYKARIDVLTSLSNIYRVQVDAVVSKASLEKLKIDVFQAQVQAYGAQVQAKNSEYQGYTAAIGGETAKVQAYGAQVQAYATQVQGYRATIDAKSEVVRATATTNDARARQYTAALSGYQTLVQAKGEVARTQLENQRQTVVAFQAQTQAAVSTAQVQSEYYRATSMVGIENAKLSISAMVQSADLRRAYGSSLAQLHTANATIHGNLAGAAMSGMNSLAVESVITSA
jgi:hypothetical protein